MAKLRFSRKGSKTTTSIDNTVLAVRNLWETAHNNLGANIVRVRKDRERYGYEQGATFDSFHYGKVSVYRQKPDVLEGNALYFANKIPLGRANKGMQILEIHNNIDLNNTYKALDHIKYVTETGYITRLFKRIFLGIPMTLNS